MTSVVDRPETAESSVGESTPTGQVGYGKPPISGRFRPGVSGNPRGRPRKPKNEETSLDDVLAAKINVTGPDGKQKSITYQNAIRKRLVIDSAKGVHKATQLLLKHYPGVLTKDVQSKSEKDATSQVRLRRLLDRLSPECRIELKEANQALMQEDAEREA